MSDAKKKVKEMFSGFGAPPAPEDAVGNLQIPHMTPDKKAKVEPTSQLNLRVPQSTKRRVRVLAARDNISLSEWRCFALMWEQVVSRCTMLGDGRDG